MELFILHVSSFLAAIVNPAYLCSGFQCPQCIVGISASLASGFTGKNKQEKNPD